MDSKKYLDFEGLLYFMQLIKQSFALVSHTHPLATEYLDGLLSKEDKKLLSKVCYCEVYDADTTEYHVFD